MLKKIVTTYIPKFFAKLGRNRIIKSNDNVVKVNLGSGLTVAPGWINLDLNVNVLFAKAPSSILSLIYRFSGAKQWYKEEEFISKLRNNRFVLHRIEYGLPFEDNSVNVYYTSHFLEHIFRYEVVHVLKECYRTLKKGGLIRIVIPDLEIAFKLYQQGQKEKALELFFVDGADYLSNHKYMYDFDMMKNILAEIGFVRIEKQSYRNGNTPDIDILDWREDVSLYLEAYKE